MVLLLIDIENSFTHQPEVCLHFHLTPANPALGHNQESKDIKITYHSTSTYTLMGLLPDTQNCGCACAGNAGNVFPVAAGKRSRHASRHVRYARAVMHAGIAKKQFPSKSAAGENVPGIPGACATCHFAYLVRGPCRDQNPAYYLGLDGRLNRRVLYGSFTITLRPCDVYMRG